MAAKTGSWGIRAAELKQDREFRPLMCCEGGVRIKAPRRDVPLRVPMFLFLRDHQPREAWVLGWMAGWPECRRVA